MASLQNMSAEKLPNVCGVKLKRKEGHCQIKLKKMENVGDTKNS